MSLEGVDINLICPEHQQCEFLKARIKKTVIESSDLQEFSRKVKFIVLDKMIKSFSFKMYKNKTTLKRASTSKNKNGRS